jgi:hypothetical protein
MSNHHRIYSALLSYLHTEPCDTRADAVEKRRKDFEELKKGNPYEYANPRKAYYNTLPKSESDIMTGNASEDYIEVNVH